MARRKRTTNDQPIGVGLTTRQMKRKKALGSEYLLDIDPLTDNQRKLYDAYAEGKHLVAYGCAGTGKTFIMIYLAMKAVLSRRVDQQKVYIVRSMLPTRDIGFLPGSQEEKMSVYTEPYYSLFDEMFPGIENPYELAKYQDIVQFVPTSYIRGITLRDAFIIVDECQNLNFHELDTIITRVGQDSKIFFCGDFGQSDLTRTNERNGLMDFLQILHEMNEFNCTEFNIGDIVRSGFVRSYLIQKTKLGMGIE